MKKRTIRSRLRLAGFTVATTGLVAALTAVIPVVTAQPAHAFGTDYIKGNGEHEKITRAALQCKQGQASDGSCFEEESMTQLAGKFGYFGGVGAPDQPAPGGEIFNHAAHCDNADYLTNAGYPNSREQASKTLLECISHLRGRFGSAADHAIQILGDDQKVKQDEVKIGWDKCDPSTEPDKRAKCGTIIFFGRALHGVQDFYSHSNWADLSTPGKPVTPENPYGMGHTEIFPLLDFNLGMPPASDVPRELSTGCFSFNPWGCSKRVTHGSLNKDGGNIDPKTGGTSEPGTDRGKISVEGRTNFDRAVKGAIADTQRQWANFRKAIVTKHGEEKGNRIVCALTHDKPMEACNGGAPQPNPTPNPTPTTPTPTDKVQVETYADAPGHKAPGGERTGTLNAGTNYVFCRQWGPEVKNGDSYNHWWMKTDLDSGNPWQGQWVPAYYLKNQGNDVANDNTGKPLPDCGGAAPTQSGLTTIDPSQVPPGQAH